MKQSDWDILARFGITPDNLTHDGTLDLEGAKITALPDGLTVGGNLDIAHSAITALPDDLIVEGWIFAECTAVPVLLEDDRDFRLVRAGRSYISGCRNFTAAEALKHWGAPDYPNQERGQAYCAAIIAEEARIKEIAA